MLYETEFAVSSEINTKQIHKYGQNIHV